MTLEQAERAVLMLMDEYNGGEGDEELLARMPELFDMSQKQLAQIQKIVRNAEIPESTEEYELPEDCMKVFRVWEGEQTTQKWEQIGRVIRFRRPAKRVVEYFARPQTITEDTPETYEFEISEEAAACMPPFVAAALLSTDMVQSGRELTNIYSAMVSALDTALPETNRGGVKQKLWRS